MHRYVLTGVLVAGALAGGGLAAAELAAEPGSNAGTQNYRAVFSGFNELGELNAETGAIFSPGRATIELRLNQQAQTLSYTLQLSGLSAPVTQAHIHFGKVHSAGGIMVFLCSNLNNGPAGTPACPNSGTVTGTVTAADVQAIPGENVTAGEFAALVAALQSSTAYANIHTQNFPAGEIRGEVFRTEP